MIISSGADDDGSGTVSILESYRALISSNFRPVRPVEFHWYSAEVSQITSSVGYSIRHLSNRKAVSLGAQRSRGSMSLDLQTSMP